MKKINHKILSIPPYISTSWKNVDTLHMKKNGDAFVLIIALHNGTVIDIPDLDSELINQVFVAHASYVENESKEKQQKESAEQRGTSKKGNGNSFFFGIPIQTDKMEGVDGGNAFLQHTPELSHLSQMPPDIIQKVISITKVFGVNLDQMNIAKAEPHCNCPYCQIVRAIQRGSEEMTADESVEEVVTEEDLRFRDWDIKQEGDKLYIVTNPLNAEEHYQVFLGNPIGCTCGKKNCEHVRTVLNS